MSTTALPTLGAPRDVYRYRKQRGVNLGEYRFAFFCSDGTESFSRLMVGDYRFARSWPFRSFTASLRFVLEKWITPYPFRNAGSGESDLQIAAGADARKVFEEHWASWIQDSDWQWIVQHGYNTVRIPVCIPLRYMDGH
jgi:aryl-phospho-beta-D-glucosidase BglC (GH1 family)